MGVMAKVLWHGRNAKEGSKVLDGLANEAYHREPGGLLGRQATAAPLAMERHARETVKRGEAE